MQWSIEVHVYNVSMVHGGRRGINGPWGEEGHQWSMGGGGASMVHRGRRGINGPGASMVQGHQWSRGTCRLISLVTHFTR